MMQVKANSEVVSSLWPADEFADFENGLSVQNNNKRIFTAQNLVRWAVTKGLDYENKLGENPYKLSFTGGSDTHNGTPSDVSEDNYIGSHGGGGKTIERPPAPLRVCGQQKTLDLQSGMLCTRVKAS